VIIANANHPEEWTRWCDATGRSAPAGRAMQLESFDLVLQAGLSGSGLVMGRTPMIADALARGDLVAPFPEWVTTDERYYVVWPVARPPVRHAEAVLTWLLESARAQA
jgi:DNA-binding transcriptional LysR family regulator